MPEATNYELAEKDYVDGMKYKDIAEKYGVSLNTVKSWKTRYEWNRDNKKGVHTKKKKVRTQKGGQPGNKNAEGHGAPPGNKNNERHGFFAKWLPEETFAIFKDVEDKAPIDLLWDNIQLQYTAIIRAQHIMFVKSKEELTKELKRQKESHGETSNSWEKEYELQFAWDKQASFLQAQSRAMKTLESMIKQYDSMVNNDSSKASEEQRLRIAKLKYEVSQLSGGNDGDTSIKDFLKAIKPSEEDIKNLFADEEVIEDEKTSEE